MKKKANQDLRTYIKEHGVYQWEVADALKVSETRFCAMLRHELADEQKEEIKEITRKCAESEN